MTQEEFKQIDRMIRVESYPNKLSIDEALEQLRFYSEIRDKMNTRIVELRSKVDQALKNSNYYKTESLTTLGKNIEFDEDN